MARGLMTVALLLMAGAARAASPPAIAPGALELGISGSTVTVEGTTRADFAIRGGPYFAAGSGRLGLELAGSYAHVASLDEFGAEIGASWQRAWHGGPLYPFVAVGGGLRQERIGSFRWSRHPVGFGVGIKALMSERVGLRAEYRFRRVLGDPVADFDEHQTSLGISLYLRNARRGEP